MNYLFGQNSKNVKRENRELFKSVHWMDKHFYFIEVESVKEARDFRRFNKKRC